MNNRQKKWKKEVQEGINYYEFKTDTKYDYYGNLNRRHHIRSTKGLKYYINWIIRLALGITLMVITLHRLLG